VAESAKGVLAEMATIEILVNTIGLNTKRFRKK
jgi:hypothetical protein